MFWPLDHAHHSVGHGHRGCVVALGEGQQESQDPDDKDDYLGGCPCQPGLEGMDDGHIPGTERKGQNSDLITKIYSRLCIVPPKENFPKTLDSW